MGGFSFCCLWILLALSSKRTLIHFFAVSTFAGNLFSDESKLLVCACVHVCARLLLLGGQMWASQAF